MTARAAALALVTAACALAGCGVGPGGTDEQPDDLGPGVGYGGDAPSKVSADPARLGLDLTDSRLKADASAERAAATYGLASGNWSWETYAKQQDGLARLAVGGLRRGLLANRPTKSALEALGANEQLNLAEVVAVDTVAAGAGTQTVVVVLRELTAEQGVSDPTPRHAVYRAKLVRTTAGWRLSAWTPLP